MAIALNGEFFEGTQSLTTFPITIAGWFRRSDTLASACLVMLGDNRYAAVKVDASGYVGVAQNNGFEVRSAYSAQALPTTGWMHVAANFQESARSVWINGSSAASDGNTSTGARGTPMAVGATTAKTEVATYLEIGGLALWAGTLTADEIASLAAGAPPETVAPQLLQSIWRCDDANTLPDLMGAAPLAANTGSMASLLADNPPALYAFTRSMIPVRVPLAPWKRLAPWYDVTVYMEVYNIAEYVDFSSLSIKDTGGMELETASFTMRVPGFRLPPYEWKELRIFTEYGTINQQCLFAGFVTRDVAGFSQGGEEVHMCRAEGYKTFLLRSKPFSKTWKNETVTDVLKDMLYEGEVYDFTVSAPAETLGFWSIDLDESITKNIERLCAEQSWVWRVTWEKEIVIGPATADAAPFGICEGSVADYYAMFPVDSVEFERDGAQITNAILLTGGIATSDTQTATFTGDGVTTDFVLPHHPIYEIVSIEVDAAVVSWGTIGYHSCSERDALVHFAQGYVRFCTAPGNGDSVEVQYTYQFPYTYSASDAASQSVYGVTLWERINAPWISDDTQAAAYTDAIFAERAVSPQRVTASLRRIGLRAGQSVRVEFPGLGMDAGQRLAIESIGTSFNGKRRLIQTLRLGPANERLSQVIQSLV